jgi:hypothetical protein
MLKLINPCISGYLRGFSVVQFMLTGIDYIVVLLGLLYYGFMGYVFLLRASGQTAKELKLKYLFSLQLIPFTAVFLVNLYLGEYRKAVTLVPLLVFLGYEFWYRAYTMKKPLHHPDKMPPMLMLYILLLYAGSIGLNWYGFLVSKQLGLILVIGFFIMLGTYANYQLRYNKREKTETT